MDSDRSDEEDSGTVSLSEFDRTLDALGLNDLRDGTKYFISFTKQLFNQAALKNLPKDKFVIQIRSMRNVPREQIALYKQLKDYGYTLALVNVDAENLDKELLGLADYCRFSTTSIGPAEQARIIRAAVQISPSLPLGLLPSVASPSLMRSRTCWQRSRASLA